MKGYRKISLGSLDKRWGKLVRDCDGRCAYCGCTQNIAAHHIFPRSRSGTRYVLKAGIVLCPAHHVFSYEFSAHKTPEKFKRWIKKYLGAKEYRRLEKLSLGKTTRAQARKEFEILIA